MAATISTVGNHAGDDVWGARRVAIVRVTADDSYPTDGYFVGAPSSFGMTQIDTVLPGAVLDAGEPVPELTVAYNPVDGKLLFIDTGVEVVNATDLTDVEVVLTIIGN